MKPCLFLVLMSALLLCSASCSAVKPDGGLKDLVDGELFSGDSTKEPVREDERQMEPLGTGGPVRWKVRF